MDDLQRVAEALADRLHRAVAIDDPQLRLLAHTSHTEEVDELRVESILRLQVPQEIHDHMMSLGIARARQPVRIPAVPEFRLLPRLCVPVRCQDQLLGYLWLLESKGPLSDSEVAAAVDAADAAGQVLARQQLLGDLRASRERELLRDLLSDDDSLRPAAAEALVEEELAPPAKAVVALAVAVDEALDVARRASMDATLRRVARRTGPGAALSLTRGNGRGLVLLCGRRSLGGSHVREVADALRESLPAALDVTARVCVGIGPEVGSLELAYLSGRRAWEAIAVTNAIPSLGEVVAWDELGVYKLLARLPRHDVEDTLPDGLVRLLEADTSGALVETLETWLDEACDLRATISRLSVHRTSLYYRIGRIEEISGMSLGRGEDRLALHLGVKVARLLGRLPPGR